MESLSSSIESVSSSPSISSDDSFLVWSRMTEKAKELLRLPETLNPLFQSLIANSALEFTICKENIEFLRHYPLNSLFYQTILEHAANLTVETREQFDERLIVKQSLKIMVPNDDALRCLIYKDVCKYSIPLVVSTLGGLRDTIQHFRKGLADGHLYCGIMVLEDEPLYGNNWFHAVALLCYFGPKIEGEVRRKEEFVLVGSEGDRPSYHTQCELFSVVNRHLIFMNMCGMKIQRKEKYLQLRRTNARIFLRNALLDLKHRKEERSLFELLSDHKSPRSNELLSLPPNWIYHEELTSVLDATLRVVRDSFSKIALKSENPRTVCGLRLSKYIQVDNKCTLVSSKAFIEKILGLNPGVKIYEGIVTKSGLKIEYTVNSRNYGYLVHKSWKDRDAIFLAKGEAKAKIFDRPSFVRVLKEPTVVKE